MMNEQLRNMVQKDLKDSVEKNAEQVMQVVRAIEEKYT